MGCQDYLLLGQGMLRYKVHDQLHNHPLASISGSASHLWYGQEPCSFHRPAMGNSAESEIQVGFAPCAGGIFDVVLQDGPRTYERYVRKNLDSSDACGAALSGGVSNSSYMHRERPRAGAEALA